MQHRTADLLLLQCPHTSLQRIPEPSVMLSHWLMLQRPPPKQVTQNAPQIIPQAVSVCANTASPPAYWVTVSASHPSAGHQQHKPVPELGSALSGKLLKPQRQETGMRRKDVQGEPWNPHCFIFKPRTKLMLRTLKFLTGLNPLPSRHPQWCPTRQESTVLCQFSHVALFLVISPQFLSNYSLNLLSKNHLQDMPSLYQQFTLLALPEIFCSFFTSQPCLNVRNHTN